MLPVETSLIHEVEALEVAIDLIAPVDQQEAGDELKYIEALEKYYQITE